MVEHHRTHHDASPILTALWRLWEWICDIQSRCQRVRKRLMRVDTPIGRWLTRRNRRLWARYVKTSACRIRLLNRPEVVPKQSCRHDEGSVDLPVIRDVYLYHRTSVRHGRMKTLFTEADEVTVQEWEQAKLGLSRSFTVGGDNDETSKMYEELCRGDRAVCASRRDSMGVLNGLTPVFALSYVYENESILKDSNFKFQQDSWCLICTEFRRLHLEEIGLRDNGGGLRRCVWLDRILNVQPKENGLPWIVQGVIPYVLFLTMRYRQNSSAEARVWPSLEDDAAGAGKGYFDLSNPTKISKPSSAQGRRLPCQGAMTCLAGKVICGEYQSLKISWLSDLVEIYEWARAMLTDPGSNSWTHYLRCNHCLESARVCDEAMMATASNANCIASLTSGGRLNLRTTASGLSYHKHLSWAQIGFGLTIDDVLWERHEPMNEEGPTTDRVNGSTTIFISSQFTFAVGEVYHKLPVTQEYAIQYKKIGVFQLSKIREEGRFADVLRYAIGTEDDSGDYVWKSLSCVNSTSEVVQLGDLLELIELLGLGSAEELEDDFTIVQMPTDELQWASS